MEYSGVTFVAFACAGMLFLILAAVMAVRLPRQSTHWTLALAALGHACWLATVAFGQLKGASPLILLTMEALHYNVWVFALIRTTEHICGQRLPTAYKALILLTCLAILTYDLVNFALPEIPEVTEQAQAWQILILSLACLLCVEQMYRNITNVRVIKLFSINLAVIFIFDAYLSSRSLMFGQLEPGLWQARAAVNIVTSVLMTVGLLALCQQNAQSARLTISRPLVFYTTSLTLAVSLLTVLAIGGYYVRLYGGEWGTVIYALVFISAIMLLLFVFASRTVRESLGVIINKHLFSHKYDYRAEWLRLINQLSQPTAARDVYTRAICVVADIFKSGGGALWLKHGQVLVPVHQVNMTVDVWDAIEPETSDFIRAMEEAEWVFLPNSAADGSLQQYNEYLPDWARELENIWLILPLLNEVELIGFMVLTAPPGDPSLNWEDLDLLKTVGRQVASYLERHEQAEKLAEARQFDAFNKLGAFVMHDLKNLIAQQSLVVKNAERHKDNPAFIEDAIQTVENSVLRMNNLLRKLQHNEPEEVRTLDLHKVLLEAVKRCQGSSPAPALRGDTDGMHINADQDSLVMVFIHLIQNAQDATPANGYIEITVDQDVQVAMIAIEDNGTGMSEDFIRNKLFRPFETTKEGKGMGIGVYQAREYVHELGGALTVESTPGEGTTFVISLPILKQAIYHEQSTETQASYSGG